MNLLGLLMAAMTTKNALGQIAKKTGLSEKQIKKLMLIAIPILIKYLTKNASSGDGAHSLLGALAQHSNKASAIFLVTFLAVAEEVVAVLTTVLCRAQMFVPA